MVASGIVEEADTQASPQPIMESSPLREASDTIEEADTLAPPRRNTTSRTPLRPHNTQEYHELLDLTTGNRTKSLRGCIDEQECRKATGVQPALRRWPCGRGSNLLRKIPSLPTDTVSNQTSSPLSQVMLQLVWDNIFGTTTSQGICCQGLGPCTARTKRVSPPAV
jgi:hypothetical protein